MTKPTLSSYANWQELRESVEMLANLREMRDNIRRSLCVQRRNRRSVSNNQTKNLSPRGGASLPGVQQAWPLNLATFAKPQRLLSSTNQRTCAETCGHMIRAKFSLSRDTNASAVLKGGGGTMRGGWMLVLCLMHSERSVFSNSWRVLLQVPGRSVNN